MDPDHEVIRRMGRMGEITVHEDCTARAIERARRAVLNAASRQRPAVVPTSRLVRTAASIVFLAGVSLAVAFGLWQVSKPSVAFAEVQERIEQTRSIQLVETKSVHGQTEKNSHLMILGNGLTRIDRADGSYSIIDVRERKSMWVSADRERATIWHGLPPHVATNLYAYIRNLHHESARELPPRTIEGIEAAGFSVTVQHEVLGQIRESKVNIWVDPRTNLPVRMEWTDGSEAVTVLHGIRFDEEIDESLARFEPPAGATVEEIGPAHPPSAAVQAAVDRIRSGKPAEPGSERDVIGLRDVLALWEAGKKDDAVEQLASIKWGDVAVLAGTPVMSISEEEFLGLNREERTLVVKKAIALAGPIKALARHAFSLGEQADASGDREAAREHYAAVLRLGGALATPDRLKLLQQLGLVLVAWAGDRLATVE